VREAEPNGNEKKDETERGVEAMLEARLDEMIEALEREFLPASTAATSEADETREVVLDEITEVEEGVGDGWSAAACRLFARQSRRKRRSRSKADADFQILGRNSGSFDSCSSVKYMIAMRKVWLVVVQKYWRADRLGITDDRGCPDDEDGDADRERRWRESRGKQSSIPVVQV
jgi:hypothetical protein